MHKKNLARKTIRNFLTGRWAGVCLGATLPLLTLSPSRADLMWDPASTSVGSDGLGVWDLTTPIWAMGGSNTVWSNLSTDRAIFGSGGAAGTVTVSGTVATNGIVFNPGVTGSYTLTGGTILLSGTTPTITANSAATIASTLGGTEGLVKNGSGKLTLAGANSYTGTTTVSNGILEVVSGGSFGTGNVINNSSVSFNISTGTTSISNAISGTGSVTKTGSGILALEGANTYTGTTIAAGGTLLVNGTLSASNNVFVGGGATLGGTGNARVISVLAGGAVSPGTIGAIGTLSGTSLSLASDSATGGLIFDLGMDNASDLLSLTGAFNRASTGASILYPIEFNYAGPDIGTSVYTLVTYGSTNFTTASLANFVVSGLPDYAIWSLSLVSNSLVLTVAVPEPAHVGFAFAGLMGLAAFLRHRRRVRGAQG